MSSQESSHLPNGYQSYKINIENELHVSPKTKQKRRKRKLELEEKRQIIAKLKREETVETRSEDKKKELYEFKECEEMCEILGIDKTHTTIKRPQSEGTVKKSMNTIKEMLSIYVDERQKNWDQYLAVLMMAYRSSVHQSTGGSPCNMMLGREITPPVDLVLGVP
ncbi:unnamed protein product [Mytilus coruscus]|uniref:Integrase catalytic domain-containing protein n=1 Tax=Mytilus coruscus TaxID=42192 RepID=A0A6J8EH74_MYTCO|nr:unnamed protein product [Mytilus coruscus]